MDATNWAGDGRQEGFNDLELHRFVFGADLEAAGHKLDDSVGQASVAGGCVDALAADAVVDQELVQSIERSADNLWAGFADRQTNRGNHPIGQRVHFGRRQEIFQADHSLCRRHMWQITGKCLNRRFAFAAEIFVSSRVRKLADLFQRFVEKHVDCCSSI